MGLTLILLLAVGAYLLFELRRLGRKVDELERDLAELRHWREAPQPEAATAPAAAPALPASEPASRASRAAEPAPELDDALPEPRPPAAAEPVRETAAALFERFVGGRLLIWTGGVALAVAGVFLVRYSIEIGLVTPPVRMLIAAGFGLLLIAAGEYARRRSGDDQRIAQALVGAGIFVLYAATYGSLTLYGLIGLGTASALMALITAGALALALRHGVPTAAMGLTGGFLTPLLVGDPDASAVPLLGYLALLNAALFALAQRRGWSWMAVAAVVLSFLWTAALLRSDANDALAAGIFVAAMGIAASLAEPGGGRPLRLIQPAALALIQLAVLVGRTDLGLPAWALFGALAAASLFLAERRAEYRLLPAIALALALVLLAGKAALGDPLIAYAGAVATLLFAGFGWWRLKRGAEPMLWAGLACAGLAGPAIILRAGEAELLARPLWGALFAALAAAAGFLAWSRRGDAAGASAAVPALASATAALLLMIAAYDLVPLEWVPAAWLALAAGAATWAARLGAKEPAPVAGVVAGAGAILEVALLPALWLIIALSLAGEAARVDRLPSPLDALRLLLIPAALLVAIRHLAPAWPERARAALTLGAVLFGTLGAYVLFKQLLALRDAEDFVARGFAERTLITQALFAAGWLLVARAAGRAGWRRLGIAFTALAAARLVWFDLIIHNPALTSQWVGSLPVLNLLLPAYLGAAAWLFAARLRAGAASGPWLSLSLLSLLAGSLLLVRQGFQGPLLAEADLPRGEFYGYSLAGLLLAIALLGAGVRRADKPLRFAGLILLTATVFKVFLIDAAELEGVLRILSFLGLGVALIGVGKLYATVLSSERDGKAGAEAAPRPG
ncbi:MAG TPA: DUF2339 domain-containing protein [Allosphingosinicella sp.]